MHGQDLSDVWTPKLVGERLIEAVRWARYAAGATGPAGIGGAMMPLYLPTIEERIENDWLDPPADEEPPPVRRQYSPAQVSAMEAALYWPSRYAVPGLPTSARILNLWLRCKVYRGSKFGDVIERRGEMSRASAYRMRDRALSAIAQGLMRDGVPV